MGEFTGENLHGSKGINESIMVKVYGSEKRIGFNPGHTDYLRKSYPWIDDINDQRDLPSTVMSIDVEKLSQALIDHASDSPFAIVDIAIIIGEELLNKQNPNQTLSDLKSDDATLEEMRERGEDMDEIPDYEDDLLQTAQILRDSLIINPIQILAVNNLLKNDNFKSALKTFIEKYGSDDRSVYGLYTGKTQQKHLDDLLQKINATLDEMHKQLITVVPFLRENEALLRKYNIPSPKE